MQIDKFYRNVGWSFLTIATILGLSKLVGTSMSPGFYIIIFMLVLMYLEIEDKLSKLKRR